MSGRFTAAAASRSRPVCVSVSASVSRPLAAALPLLLLLTCIHQSLPAPASPEGGERAVRTQPENVTATVGRVADIPCPLKDTSESDKLVWQDLGRNRILAVNHHAVVEDPRFSAAQRADGTWVLSIQAVQLTDAGTFRCQLNQVLAHDVTLLVKSCSENEFTCSDDLCVERAYRCDGFSNCVDGDDEENCQPEDCKGTNVFCGNGKCAPLAYFCDGDDNCGNGFDEANCTRPLPVDCPVGEFPCGDGECIPLLKRCDGRRDCDNGLDEEAATCRAHAPAPADPAPPRLMQSQKLEQGETDAGSAPAQTTPITAECKDGNWKCGDGTCVPKSWWCDGEVDCDNGADERECRPVDCQPETTHCGNGQCVKGGRCDGKGDCVKANPANPSYDEDDCSANDCFPGARYCGNGRCAAAYMICDGVDNCGNGADEKFCEPLPGGASGSGSGTSPTSATIVSRYPDRVSSSSAWNESLALQRVIAHTVWSSCKLQYQVATGTLDEKLFCKNGGINCGDRCVGVERRCNGVADCSNGRDEAGCDLEAMCGKDPQKNTLRPPRLG